VAAAAKCHTELSSDPKASPSACECAHVFMALPAGAIGSLHLLPLYPSTGDRGFAPVTYQEVDPKFGEDLTMQRQVDSPEC
jgi:hypothetical protein